MGIEDPTAPELAFCDRVREKLQATKDQISNEYVLRFTYLNSTLPEEDSAFATFCEGIQKDLDWRAKARPERLLEEYHSPRLHQLYKITFFGEDKTGHPIVYTCPGKMQPSALFGEFDSDDLDRWYISIMEYGRKLSEPAAGGNGKHMVIVLDLDGIGTAHADMRLINWIRGRSSFDVYHYPNAFVKIYVVNAGWAFTGVWTLIKPILPTSTVELVEILGGQSYYLPKLLERIDAANIPDFLGPVPVGGRSGLDDHLDHLCNCLSHHAFGTFRCFSVHLALTSYRDQPAAVSYDYSLSSGTDSNVQPVSLFSSNTITE